MDDCAAVIHNAPWNHEPVLDYMAALRPLQPIGTSPTPDSAAGGRATSFVDPHTLMRIKSLQLRAKVVVEGFYSGLHRSPYHGFSVEFSEYRQYSSAIIRWD